MCDAHPPAPLHPAMEDDFPRGLSAARPTLTAQAGLFTHSPAPRRQAAPVRAVRGVVVTQVGSTAPVEPKPAGHPLDELLFTWATLQSSVSASDSSQTSSAFQNLCCLTDYRYVSFILALHLLYQLFRLVAGLASCRELGFPTADHSPSFYLLPGTHGLFHRRSLPHRGISKLQHVVNHFIHPWTAATSGLSCANLLPEHRKAWNGVSADFHPAETAGGF